MSSRDSMVALVHDLKNPLVGIERLSERLLESNTSMSDDCRRKIRLVHDSAVQAVKQIEEHNLSSWAESKLGEGSSTSFDLRKMARDVVESFRAHAEYKDQTIDWASSTGNEECPVLGDPIQLREAMNALVSNAVKYSPHGETIAVHVRSHDDTICFYVRDNGPGLGEDAQRQVFEPFQQAEPEPTGNESSTGVGLYIARKIVNAHDGTIEVESRRGAGSTFCLRIPAAASSSDLSTSTFNELQVNASDASVRHRVS